MRNSVSILIPTRNRSSILARCLAALPLGTQGVVRPEVIVVDDCSQDSTPQVIEDFAQSNGWQVRCLRQERPLGANAARNAALKIARGEVIVLIDDDAIVTEGWLKNLLNGLSTEYPVVSGAMRLTLEGPLLGKHREEIQGTLGEVLETPIGLDGQTVPVLANLAAFRWVFERATFDETVLPPVEEAEWLGRAGVRSAFVPDALVWHYKTKEDLKPGRIFSYVWLRGREGGWWIRERLKMPFRVRLSMAGKSLRTAIRSFGHAVWQRCWGGVVIGLGELSMTLALLGIINRGSRAPKSWR
jgi:glycosyltransferase involved in cell wall biosynthesis